MGRQLKQYVLIQNHQINNWVSFGRALYFQNHLSSIYKSHWVSCSWKFISNFVFIMIKIWSNPTGTPRRIDVDSTSILRRYIEDQISMNFWVISTYFFGVIFLIKKSTSFPPTFFDVIRSVFEKSTLFPRTFFDAISLDKKSTLFYVPFCM